jgi:hypothetical protein
VEVRLTGVVGRCVIEALAVGVARGFFATMVAVGALRVLAAVGVLILAAAQVSPYKRGAAVATVNVPPMFEIKRERMTSMCQILVCK